jgi:hypothetical protein
METVSYYLSVAITFLLFTFSPQIMALSIASTFCLSLMNRFLFMARNKRAITNIFGFPKIVYGDVAVIDTVFEYLFIVFAYVAVYAACLVAWSHYIHLHPEFLQK